MEPKVKVGRSEFVDGLSFHLSRTWLASLDRIRQVLREMLGGTPTWSETLCIVVHDRFAVEGHANQRQLRKFLGRLPLIKKQFPNGRKLQVCQAIGERQQGHGWSVPKAHTEAQLQDLLCVKSPVVLDWLVAPHRRRQSSVEHYERESIRKRDGRIRLIEKPKPVMKRVQRKIAKHVLSSIPLHPAAHGFVPGRSIFSAATVHCGKSVVLCMDLENFFGSIDRSRTAALFRRCGYPASVAYTLSCICTTPAEHCSAFQKLDSPERDILKVSRLPQGAPTSPGIANAVAFRLDQRLDGLARSVGATFTRYGDDLTLSGDGQFVRSLTRLIPLVGAIAMEEGFAVNHRKTRRMFSGHRQSVLGLTVNATAAASRDQYQELKALLFNCVRNGPESQNREGVENFREHLRGRVSFVGLGRPKRHEKLLNLFHKIHWQH